MAGFRPASLRASGHEKQHKTRCHIATFWLLLQNELQNIGPGYILQDCLDVEVRGALQKDGLWGFGRPLPSSPCKVVRPAVVSPKLRSQSGDLAKIGLQSGTHVLGKVPNP